MDYTDLAYERIASFERERQARELAAEARRLGLTRTWTPLANVDQLLIRAGKGASQRQARREYRAT